MFCLFIEFISFSIVLSIEVHNLCLIMSLEMKGHWSPVNLEKRKALLKDLHATNGLSFPNANEQKRT